MKATPIEEAIDRLPCRDRGDLLRKEPCRPCHNEGRVELPIYACEVFGECIVQGTPFNALLKVHKCLTCKVRKP